MSDRDLNKKRSLARLRSCFLRCSNGNGESGYLGVPDEADDLALSVQVSEIMVTSFTMK